MLWFPFKVLSQLRDLVSVLEPMNHLLDNLWLLELVQFLDDLLFTVQMD